MMPTNEELTGPLAPIWLVMGDAGPLVDEAVGRIEAAGIERCGLPAFNHASYRVSDGGADQAFATARTQPMMADLRVVVVRELEEGDDAFYEALVDYARDPSPSTVIVASGSGFPKVKKGGKNWSARVQNAVKKTGRVVKLSTRDVRPDRFATERARQVGKELAAREARLLVELVGQDLGCIAQEVDKIALYIGERPRITDADLRQVCCMVAESVIWDLTAGIATRDPRRALSALHRQLDEGVDSRRLLAMIAWQLRSILKGAELIRAGRPAGEIARVARLRRDLLDQVRAAVRRKELPGAADVFEKLARANRAMNEHRAGDQRILEVLVLELCR